MWRVYVKQEPWSDGYDLYIAKEGPSGGLDAVIGFTFKSVGEGLKVSGPAIAGMESEQFMRAVMNAAWDLGIRPDGFNDTKESMAATQAHLADLKSITEWSIGEISEFRKEVSHIINKAIK